MDAREAAQVTYLGGVQRGVHDVFCSKLTRVGDGIAEGDDLLESLNMQEKQAIASEQQTRRPSCRLHLPVAQ